jgi:hypothetical protein
VKKGILYFLAVWTLLALTSHLVRAQAPQAARALGDVTSIQPGKLTLHTEKSGDVQVLLGDDVSVLRVPPGARDLKTATKITVGEISVGDRVAVVGHLMEDQKSLAAARVIVMTKSDLASEHQAEVQDWQKRGISGVVKAVAADPAKQEITIAVPNTPPTPGNPTHPVILTPTPNAVLLRYAPDSVKFSDAQPSTFGAIKVGDQVRALGNKSEDGTQYAVEKLVFGTFRNISATVVTVDPQANTVTVKNLTSGKPVVVHTTADSKMRQLPPFVAEQIARLNSGGSPSGGSTGGPPPVEGSRGGAGPGGQGGPGGGGEGRRGGMGNFNQALEHMPTVTLADLKPGEPVIVVSTEGANPSEVTAIAVLTGVEPILSARPKGSEVNLGSWNLTMGGGEGEQ